MLVNGVIEIFFVPVEILCAFILDWIAGVKSWLRCGMLGLLLVLIGREEGIEKDHSFAIELLHFSPLPVFLMTQPGPEMPVTS